MQREIKFRAWDLENLKWVLLSPENTRYFINPVASGYLYDAKFGDHVPCVLQQFTGLKDKNGKEICQDDLIRVKCGIGDEKDVEAGRYHDGYYRVVIEPLDGLVLSFTKLVNDDPLNQFPIHTSLCTRYGTLDVDSRNQKYDQIAVMETWGENHIFKNRWKQNHWSNDLEVIGNIHENPALLSNPQ